MRPLLLAPLVALSVLAAGCGGSSSPHVATVGTTTTATTPTQGGLVGYAHCMQTHGVPTFPEPDSTGGIPKQGVIAANNRNPARFNAATNACRRLQPTGGLGAPKTPAQQHQQLEDALSFARCMRRRGVTNFPDPNAQGELSIEMVQHAGIDIHSPAVLHVVQECLPASHGALTPGKVAEALHNAGG